MKKIVLNSVYLKKRVKSTPHNKNLLSFQEYWNKDVEFRRVSFIVDFSLVIKQAKINNVYFKTTQSGPPN